MARTNRTPRRRRKPRSWQEKFLEALAKLGVVSYAAKAAGVGRRTAYDLRESDPDFAARWDEAAEESIEVLEHEVFRRGVTGVLRPVFYRGKRVGSVRDFSDQLLMFTLRARRPEKYRDNHRVEMTGAANAPPVKVEHSGGVIDRIDQLSSAFADAASRACSDPSPGVGDDPTVEELTP
jgi:hypothetical protein